MTHTCPTCNSRVSNRDWTSHQRQHDIDTIREAEEARMQRAQPFSAISRGNLPGSKMQGSVQQC
jgi:hypothetical protein